MKKSLLIGWWKFVLKLPPALMEKQMQQSKKRFEAERGTLREEHRRVHHLVVRDLPGLGGPMPPETVAEKAGLPLGRAKEILDDLEKRLTFLFRNEKGEVVWAYPVTAAPTPHLVSFNTGERIHAA
ncbi:MAG: hypothetical protein V1816_14880 [Pseudomonadota bacterium]